MSKRTPHADRRHKAKSRRQRYLFFDIEHLLRSEGFHKRTRFGVVVFLVSRLDDQEKFFTRCQSESGNVEYRMIWPRKPVQKQHSKHSGKRREQNRQLIRRWNERRQAEVRPAADDDRK